MRTKFFSSSIANTQEIAVLVANQIKSGDVIVLNGDLGAGKTTFTQFLLYELGVADKVLSPTFVIMNEYNTSLSRVYHIDMYRLQEEEALNMGFYDLISSESIVIIEWNKIKIPAETRIITINISYTDSSARLFEIEGL